MQVAAVMGDSEECLQSREDIWSRYWQVRRQTECLAEPLTPEDQVVQSMTDASPAKWHRAHTTWFFETFVIQPFISDYTPYDERYGYLFNSYYDTVGTRHPRPERGLLTRPSCEEVVSYRSYVDQGMERLFQSATDDIWSEVRNLTLLGTHHEQQHQELLLMDILHAFSKNSLEPCYTGRSPQPSGDAPELTWTSFDGGIYTIGHAEGAGFAFDNEGPRHQVMLQPFRIANRLITNQEWIDFMDDGGYRRPEFWLSDGWTVAQECGWSAPEYWRQEDGSDWTQFGLNGRHPVNLSAPVCHVSHYEADAYATWANKRLPTEFEWEVAAEFLPTGQGNFLEDGFLCPRPVEDNKALKQMMGDLWEHTRSAYSPYPRFKVADGAIGEYNGKFMSNQMVLRGGSCVTPGDHIRRTYRNFFYPHQRWMFAGVRLAEDRT